MKRFSSRSLSKLQTSDERLQMLFNEVVKHYDCTVIEGHRSEERQNALFLDEKSKVQYPDSKHNSYPSMAVDVAPYVNGKVIWEPRQCSTFAGFVLGVASQLGIKIRWGGDWDQDTDVNDQSFNDLVHFELVEE